MRPPPCPSPGRVIADETVFARASRAAARCGVTRLADITRLDRIGLPVWQAVRPAGRALSVHQGKGGSPLSAKIGALCEAIESHCAENAPADGPCCPIDALPRAANAPSLADMAADRSTPPLHDAPIQWCVADDMSGGLPWMIAHDLVSLDFTHNYESPFDRSSGGLGAGCSKTQAREKAVLELIENDAVGRWERLDMLGRMEALLDIDTIPHEWFHWWHARLEACDMRLRLCALRAVTGHPVLVCLLICRDRASGTATFAGSACHGDPEIALFGALAEAIQSRLTFIAGVRDDMLPSQYRGGRGSSSLIGVLPPPPPGFPLRRWSELADRPSAMPDLLASVRSAGFPQILCKTLSPPELDIVVVKAFIPGLGSLRRTPRQEAATCA